MTLLEEVQELERQRDEIAEKLADKTQQLAEELCPYKVGQIFERTYEWGWGKRRKMRTERAILKKISRYPGKPYYRLNGVKLKQDGSESLIDAGFSWHLWKPVEKELK